MLYLTLIRHAQAVGGGATGDFSRELDAHGKHQAEVMGQRLSEIGWLPDMLMASNAPRAAQTAKIIADTVGCAPNDVIVDEDFYLAGGKSMFGTLVRYGVHAKHPTHVALVAHNPGITELAEWLADDMLSALPTCGVIRLSFADADEWTEIGGGSAAIDGIVLPDLDG